MFDGDTNFRYNDRPISDILAERAPTAPKLGPHNDFTVYVMEPYTAFDAEKAYDDADKLWTPFRKDPLFDPDEHIDETGNSNMKEALRDFWEELRRDHNCRAFIATDIDIPTHQQARERNEIRSDDEPEIEGMDPLAQSVAFAAHSDAVFFLFTSGGLTTGVGAETGGILGEFHLRRGNPATTHKPGQRIAVYVDDNFGSATIDELPKGYNIQYDQFASKDDLHRSVRRWFDNLTRETRDTNLPVFIPGETYSTQASE